MHRLSYPIVRGRLRLLPVLLVGLLAGHGVILYYASSHAALPAAALAGAVILLVMKHVRRR
jgi:ABC-type Fe3+-siderophore transport system permease subunit